MTACCEQKSCFINSFLNPIAARESARSKAIAASTTAAAPARSVASPPCAAATSSRCTASSPRKSAEVVLSYWKSLEHGNKFRKNGVTIPESCPKPEKHARLRRETCGNAVSKLHGRAPNPRARQRGGARARGGWRLPVYGENFCKFWKKFRSFSGKITKSELFGRKSAKIAKSCKNTPQKCLQNEEMSQKNLSPTSAGRRTPPPCTVGGPGAVRGGWGWY